MKKGLSTALVALTAPLAGAALMWGGSVVVVILWGVFAYDLDEFQKDYSSAFAFIGAVPIALALIWGVLAVRIVPIRSAAGILTAALFLIGAGVCSWWISNPTSVS